MKYFFIILMFFKSAFAFCQEYYTAKKSRDSSYCSENFFLFSSNLTYNYFAGNPRTEIPEYIPPASSTSGNYTPYTAYINQNTLGYWISFDYRRNYDFFFLQHGTYHEYRTLNAKHYDSIKNVSGSGLNKSVTSEFLLNYNFYIGLQLKKVSLMSGIIFSGGLSFYKDYYLYDDGSKKTIRKGYEISKINFVEQIQFNLSKKIKVNTGVKFSPLLFSKNNKGYNLSPYVGVSYIFNYKKNYKSPEKDNS